MATPPRRWPGEVEQERHQSFEEAVNAAQNLLKAQTQTDNARSKINSNPSLAIVLLSESDRSTSDALAGMERIQRCLTICKGKAISGRWPSAATRQREDAFGAAQAAADALIDAQDSITRSMDKVKSNPSLSEVLIVDAARAQAKALVLAERIARLMTEAAIGRE
jgi:hypothetical protein